MSYPPPPPRPVAAGSEDSDELIYMQRNWDIHWDPKVNIFVDTPLLKFNKTPKGYVPVLRIPPSAQQIPKQPGGLKPMYIESLGSSLTPPNPSLLICRSTNGGDIVYVAKDYEARQNAKEYYYDNGENVTVNYTYFTGTQNDSSYGDNFRLANDGTNTELQVMEKRYYTQTMMTAVNVPITQAIIYIIDTGVPTGVLDPSGKDVTNIEVKPVRVWVRYATQ